MATAVFRRGDRGPAVAEVRARLARLGLLPGSAYASVHAEDDPLASGPLNNVAEPADWATTALVSADFDEQVEEAVREFQRQRGITVDGLVGPETLARLEEARWRLGDRVLAHAPGQTPVGEDVLELQQRLNAMGFSCGREDGYLGPETDAAIREFQRNTGIDVDGICGPATFRSLGRLRRTVGRQSGQAVRERYSLSEIRTGIRGKVVVLDPCPAASPSGEPTPEAQLCADLAGRVQAGLAELGAHVLVTAASAWGTDDEASRAAFCNDVGADLVLALTIADQPAEPGGVATYYYGREGGSSSVPGQLAATLMLDGITERTRLGNRDKHAKTWDMLRLTRMPSLRVECGNLAARYDAERLADPQFRRLLARAIARSVERFFAPEHVL